MIQIVYYTADLFPRILITVTLYAGKAQKNDRIRPLQSSVFFLFPDIQSVEQTASPVSE